MGYKEEMEIDILDLCKYILMRWRMLTFGCLIGALIACIAAFFGGWRISRFSSC